MTGQTILHLLLQERRIMLPDIMLTYGPPERPQRMLLQPSWTAVLEDAALEDAGGTPYVQAESGGAEYLITASGDDAERVADMAAERGSSALLISVPPSWEEPDPGRILGFLLYTREHKRWLRSAVSEEARQEMLNAAERIPVRRKGRFARFVCAPHCPRKGSNGSGKELSVDLKCMAGCPDLVALADSAVWCAARGATGREDQPEAGSHEPPGAAQQ